MARECFLDIQIKTSFVRLPFRQFEDSFELVCSVVSWFDVFSAVVQIQTILVGDSEGQVTVYQLRGLTAQSDNQV